MKNYDGVITGMNIHRGIETNTGLLAGTFKNHYFFLINQGCILGAWTYYAKL